MIRPEKFGRIILLILLYDCRTGCSGAETELNTVPPLSSRLLKYVNRVDKDLIGFHLIVPKDDLLSGSYKQKAFGQTKKLILYITYINHLANLIENDKTDLSKLRIKMPRGMNRHRTDKDEQPSPGLFGNSTTANLTDCLVLFGLPLDKRCGVEKPEIPTGPMDIISPRTKNTNFSDQCVVQPCNITFIPQMICLGPSPDLRNNTFNNTTPLYESESIIRRIVSDPIDDTGSTNYRNSGFKRSSASGTEKHRPLNDTSFSTSLNDSLKGTNIMNFHNLNRNEHSENQDHFAFNPFQLANAHSEDNQSYVNNPRTPADMKRSRTSKYQKGSKLSSSKKNKSLHQMNKYYKNKIDNILSNVKSKNRMVNNNFEGKSKVRMNPVQHKHIRLLPTSSNNYLESEYNKKFKKCNGVSGKINRKHDYIANVKQFKKNVVMPLLNKESLFYSTDNYHNRFKRKDELDFHQLEIPLLADCKRFDLIQDPSKGDSLLGERGRFTHPGRVANNYPIDRGKWNLKSTPGKRDICGLAEDGVVTIASETTDEYSYPGIYDLNITSLDSYGTILPFLPGFIKKENRGTSLVKELSVMNDSPVASESPLPTYLSTFLDMLQEYPHRSGIHVENSKAQKMLQCILSGKFSENDLLKNKLLNVLKFAKKTKPSQQIS